MPRLISDCDAKYRTGKAIENFFPKWRKHINDEMLINILYFCTQKNKYMIIIHGTKN